MDRYWLLVIDDQQQGQDCEALEVALPSEGMVNYNIGGGAAGGSKVCKGWGYFT